MLAKKYGAFRSAVKKATGDLVRKKARIEEAKFDEFIGAILSDASLDMPAKVYCRDGFSYVHEVDRATFQVVSFQINSFGAGIFNESIVKLCTPVLVTITAHGARHFLEHSLRESCISIDDFYLGKSYSGSRGPLCDRDTFNSHAKQLFLSEPGIDSFNHRVIYQLMNANYLCHHIAETMGYAFGALDLYWESKKNLLFLTSGSCFNEARDKLHIDIIDNFSPEKMRNYFQVPHYAKLLEDIEKFKEEFDILLWEATCRNETETFFLPGGYQKVRMKMFNKNVNVITTRHIIEHVLTQYYRRKNAFVVSNTFHTLEYLSRALVARMEGRVEESTEFIKSASSCTGYYPERNFKRFVRSREAGYPRFISEYSHTMFFRPPVLL